MADNIAQPFIGKPLSITKAKNASLIGTSGTIINESKNAFVIETKNGEKTILKQGCEFNIDGNIIEGETIIKRLEERIKSWR